MRFLNGAPTTDLTYNDVFLTPNRSSVSSRLDVNLTSTDGLATPLPLIAANMTAVSGRRMAETMARRGGLAIIPQDIPTDVVSHTIAKVKQSNPVFETPVTVDPHETVGTTMSLLSRRAHGVAVVVCNHKPIGLVSPLETVGVDRFAQAQDVMTTDLVYVSTTASPQEVFDTLARHHQKVALAVNDQGKLIGLMTSKSALRAAIYSPALDDSGQLLVGAASGVNGDISTKVRLLLEANSDVIVMDTAHGHQEKMVTSLALAKKVRDQYEEQTGKHVLLVAGNVVTRDATDDLIEAGADIIKVGVGPGAMCTTRMQTGVGRPQFSAVLDCAEAAAEAGKAIWADGGVRYPRDVALALAAGAGSVMIGSWFAGTYESTGDLLLDAQARPYKESFGMASARAVRQRTREQSGFDRARAALFEEGISSARMYLDQDRPGIEDLIDWIASGIRSACTYAGARTLSEFHDRAVVGTQSASGYEEGRPLHGSW